jgi:hypothetical protein
MLRHYRAASAVNQDIDAPEPLKSLLNDPFDIVVLANIPDGDLNLAACPTQSPCCMFKGFAAATHETDSGALGNISVRRSETNSLAAARNQGHSIAKF